MADLTTKYVGLTLKSPIVVASAGITETIERMQKCQENGAGAVVMKSYFEEEISRISPTIVRPRLNPIIRPMTATARIKAATSTSIIVNPLCAVSNFNFTHFPRRL